MRVIFILPLFNNAPYIQDTLISILKQKGDFQKDILVVDDGSQDNSLHLVQKFAQKYKNIELITQSHQGEAAALNQGLCRGLIYQTQNQVRDKSRPYYDFVALVEGDVAIEKGWLKENLKKFTKNKIAAVGGRLKPFPSDNWIARIAGYEVEYKMEKRKKPPRHLTSANIIYRSSLFKKIGKFKEEFKNSCFDAEFNLRVIRAGFSLVYNNKTWAWHHYKSNLRSFLKRVWAYARYRPYIGGIASYPYDHIIRIQIIIIFILFITYPIILIKNLSLITSYLLLITYFLTTLPPIIWTLKHKKDFVILLYPLVSFLRNTVALVALIFGTLNVIASRRGLIHLS